MEDDTNHPATGLSQITRELALCRERLAQLESENAHLRESAAAFGQLAERLNHELQIERRQPPADRHPPRSCGDPATEPNSPTGSH
jgi:hypothetical protein